MVLLTTGLGLVAYRALFTTITGYDDEGYVLISLRSFFDGGALYDQVYSQYGPGFFVLVGAPLKLLGVPFTPDGARMATLVLWLGSSLLAGLALLRLTRSLLIAVPGLLLSFYLLTDSAAEPLHPTRAISLTLVAMVCAAVLLLPTRPRAAMATIGAMGMALLTIKVNVGLLALIAVGFAALVTLPRLLAHPRLRIGASVLLVLVPLALLSGNLDQAWAAKYALVVSLGLVAYAISALHLPAASVPTERHLKDLAAGAGAVLALVLVVPLLGGTSVSGLVHGVILDPLEFADLFTLPLTLPRLALVLGLAAVAAAAAVSRRLAGGPEPGAPLQAVLGAGGLAAGLAIWIPMAGPGLPGPDYVATAGYGAALAWVAAVPPGPARPEDAFVRALIPALALLQLLHGYPIAGSQVGAAELLLVIVGGICIADGARRLRESRLWEIESMPRFTSTALQGAAALSLVVFTAWLCLVPLRDYARGVDDSYRAGVPLGLPGAERLRLPPAQVKETRALVAEIRSRCRSFLTMPGMNSLYLYTGQDPPTRMNATAWMWLFDEERQAEIVDAVRGRKGLCAVRNQLLEHFWTSYAGPIPEGRPLVRFIDRRFRPVARFGQTFNVTEVMTERRAGG